MDVFTDLIGQMGKYDVNPEVFYETNVLLTMRLLSYCNEAHVKQFIFCSTPGVQGFGHRLSAENIPYPPRNEYEITKVEAEQEIIDFCEKEKIKYTILDQILYIG